jgi:chaperone BCS1
LKNKEWYKKKGIPYTLGFGLHGDPGTGKTTFIKSLANYTGRNVVCISLKLIKTKNQLLEFFYEDKYNACNQKNRIRFSDKIIVIEDIDAQGDVVLNRSNTWITSGKNDEKDNRLIKALFRKGEENTFSTTDEDEEITLDDILNLWDGVEENTGRMIVITSNHYDKLDPALIRPGRIDISLKMKKVSQEIIRQLFRHLYEKEMDEEHEYFLKRVPEYYYSPAEITNMYTMCKDDSLLFMKALAVKYEST